MYPFPARSVFALLCWYAALIAPALTNGGGLRFGMLGIYVCLVVSIYLGEIQRFAPKEAEIIHGKQGMQLLHFLFFHPV